MPIYVVSLELDEVVADSPVDAVERFLLLADKQGGQFIYSVAEHGGDSVAIDAQSGEAVDFDLGGHPKARNSLPTLDEIKARYSHVEDPDERERLICEALAGSVTTKEVVLVGEKGLTDTHLTDEWRVDGGTFKLLCGRFATSDGFDLIGTADNTLGVSCPACSHAFGVREGIRDGITGLAPALRMLKDDINDRRHLTWDDPKPFAPRASTLCGAQYAGLPYHVVATIDPVQAAPDPTPDERSHCRECMKEWTRWRQRQGL
jgi:hypothetical protein